MARADGQSAPVNAPAACRRYCSNGTNGYNVSVEPDVSCQSSLAREPVMKLSARNQLKGKIVEVTKGATTSHVRIEIGQGVVITSSITNEAVADLGLQKGDAAWAVIKASDVIIGK
jgi:molybdopterin-binding protein